MDFQKLIKRIIAQLDKNVNPNRLAGAQKNYPSSMIIKGVPVPKLRPIVKELNQKFTDWTEPENMTLGDFHDQCYEFANELQESE